MQSLLYSRVRQRWLPRAGAVGPELAANSGTCSDGPAPGSPVVTYRDRLPAPAHNRWSPQLGIPHTTAVSAAGPDPRPGGPRKPHQHHPLDRKILAREMLAAPRRGWVSDQKAGRPRAAACGLVARETIRGEFLGILISGEERPHESAAWSELSGEGHKERLLRSEWGSGAASGQSRSSWVKLAERLPL